MISISHQIYNILYFFGYYLLVMFVFLGTAVGMHELGHILFAKYHHLEYRILYQKGNITVSADWASLGRKKVYGHISGIIFGLPPVIIGGWLYSTPIFLLLYLISCYDDFSAVASMFVEYEKIF